MQSEAYQIRTDTHRPSRPPAGKILSIRRRTGRPPAELHDAVDWLSRLLNARATIRASDIRIAFKSRQWGFSWRSVERAKAWLGVQSKRLGNRWLWVRPGQVRQKPAGRIHRLLADLHKCLPTTNLDVSALADTRSVPRAIFLRWVRTRGARQRPAHDWAVVEDRLVRYLSVLRLNAATRQRLRNASDVGVGFIAGVLDRAAERLGFYDGRSAARNMRDQETYGPVGGGWVWDQIKRFREGKLA